MRRVINMAEREADKKKSAIVETIRRVAPDLPPQALTTYAHLWSLESWLRQMVYLEFKAKTGDAWDAPFPPAAAAHREADVRLTHMPTRERSTLAYVSFSRLCAAIGAEWSVFQLFLPKRSIWEARLEEVSQIRNRVAHFRRGHTDDLQRVVQLMRDLDAGMWHFCTSYNASQPWHSTDKDPVFRCYAHLDPFRYTETENGQHAIVGVRDRSEILEVYVHWLRRPWAETLESDTHPGQPGYLYDVTVRSGRRHVIDYDQFLEGTKTVHAHVVHFCLARYRDSIRFTIPSVLGEAGVTKVIDHVIAATRYALHSRSGEGPDEAAIRRTVDAWPEYVLGPDNPLTFLTPNMPCGFFGA